MFTGIAVVLLTPIIQNILLFAIFAPNCCYSEHTENLRGAESVDSFERKLKTYIFSLAFMKCFKSLWFYNMCLILYYLFCPTILLLLIIVIYFTIINFIIFLTYYFIISIIVIFIACFYKSLSHLPIHLSLNQDVKHFALHVICLKGAI